MFAFKNAIAYTVRELPAVAELESALRQQAFTPRQKLELSRSGWAAPAPGLYKDDPLVINAAGILLIALKTQEADLKAAVIKEALAERVDSIEKNECRKVYRKERAALRDDVIQPPYQIGSRVKCMLRMKTGVIDELCEHSPGCYLVVPDSRSEEEIKSRTRWVYKFENVEPVDGVEATKQLEGSEKGVNQLSMPN